MPERDEGTGRYTGTYSDDDFVEAIENEGEPVGTGEIAKAVGCAHDTAYKRLQALETKGIITSRKVGNTLVWSISDD
ncbi:winged helix-turn-helix domain-containing protein [Halopiger djelfimassiliensis]|uniref:winged helix-turn-helix domain-containing protein n=1 Tax=Halopiger djelfimassiliensis TaxID=1293047 RepID=UPI000677AFF8|nr:winged helix-turn-helix domain-containing protein [Halopiger djelfimassiliensis]